MSKPSARLSSGKAKSAEAVARAVNLLCDGGADAFGLVTLTPSALTTAVDNGLVRAGAHITLTPLSAHAAAALGSCWVEVANGGFTIHHASNAAVDQDFSYGWTG